MAKTRKPDQWRNQITRYADMAPATLIANPSNFRTHPKNQQDALSGALTELGWIAPVIVNETTQHVIDGHARIELAISRGEPTVPVAYVSLSEHDERLALATFDPLGALAGQDDAMLTALLADLSVDDSTLSAMLRDLAPDVPKALHDDDADLTPPVEPTTRPGDLWLLGDHRLLCGDSTKAEDVEWLMAGRKADLLLADPPYGIGASDMTMGSGQSALPRDERLSAGKHWDNARPDVSHLLTVAPWVCIWGGNYFADVLPPTNDWLCWWKKNDGLSFSEFELAWTNYGHQCRHIAHHWGDEVKQHITQKPVAVIAYSIDQCPEGVSIIFDPYAGAGTTLVVSEQTGRIAHLMEIDPGYCDVIVGRWERVSGRKAVRDGAPVEVHA